MKFEIKHRYTSAVIFTAEIDCDHNASASIKLGLAVRKAYLKGAYLKGAYLKGAYLKGADLEGAIGIIPLPVCDTRGYGAYAVAHGVAWRIKAGCRWFAVEAALTHWNARPNDKIARRYVAAIEWLATQPTSIAD